MPKSDGEPSNLEKPSHTSLHPAYSVTNIQSKIRTLDGTKVTYSSWVKLFQFHAIAYKVLDHLDETPSPDPKDPTYPTWKEIDALVSQWIFSTVSDDLLDQVLDTQATARDTWLKLQRHFQSNKQAKAAALETRFVNLTLASCSSVNEYCQQLKELANQLSDVDQPVSDKRLVLQLVRGLSSEFDTTAQLIHAQQADWETARTMLNDEVIRLEARQQRSSSVLVAATGTGNVSNPNQAFTNQSPSDNNPQQPHPYQPSRGRGRGRSSSYRGRGGRGRGSRGQYTSSPSWSYNTSGQQQFPQWAWWSTPPCPYPTQPAWRPLQPQYPTQTAQSPAAHYTGFAPNYGSAPTNPMAPTAPPGGSQSKVAGGAAPVTEARKEEGEAENVGVG
ncbi:uncharacterized protein LOC118481771 [Helianthus annuus]|uniref:uncharacterized protein LOC118481771 n=1 Tax=Helianthus annuus TaxID=4232 RepID=UPI0016532E77|nr:uncharacterized protein LOC118481771 [Helianthus annuus]